MIEEVLIQLIKTNLNVSAYIQEIPQNKQLPAIALVTHGSATRRRIKRTDDRIRAVTVEVHCYGRSISETKQLQIKAMRYFESNSFVHNTASFIYEIQTDVTNSTDAFKEQFHCMIELHVQYFETIGT